MIIISVGVVERERRRRKRIENSQGRFRVIRDLISGTELGLERGERRVLG